MTQRNTASHMGSTLALRAKVKTFIALFITVMISILFSGCFYSETAEGMGEIGLKGAIVLRKPFSYDWSGAVPDKSKNYYHEYAYDILNYMFGIYGILNYDPYLVTNTGNIFSEIIRHDETPDVDISALADAYAAIGSEADESAVNFVYFYDAMRYQITNVETITEDVDGEMVTYSKVTADSNAAWNWSLPYDLPSGDANYTINSLVYEYTDYVNSATISGNDIVNKFAVEDFTYETVSNYYTNPYYEFPVNPQNRFNASLYSQKYLNNWDNPTENSEYVDALTYAIYSLVLGLKPNEINIEYDNSTGEPTLSVSGFTATKEKSSVELALEDRIFLFNKLGSYVGLTSRNKVAIAEYIINTVIGESAYSFNERMKYDAIVKAVVNYCSSLTRIGETEGKDEDDGYHGDDLDKAFPASEIVYYPYTTFFVESDPIDGDQFHGMPACEYQSVVLLPDKATSVSDVWLDFRYDADKDGDGTFDPTKFLDIKVSFRYYRGDGAAPIVKTVDMRVKDGPVNFGEDGSTLDVELDTRDMFGEALKIGTFAVPPEIDASEKENRTIVLTGMTDARRYYKLLESANGAGGYGVLNHEMFTTAYLEIAFDVQKKAGDEITNYDFNVGISNLFEPPTYADDPEWQ